MQAQRLRHPPLVDLLDRWTNMYDGVGHLFRPSNTVYPGSSQTLLFIGSTSKAFTAAALGILIDEYKEGRGKVPSRRAYSSAGVLQSPALLPGEFALQDADANVLDMVLAHIISTYSGQSFTSFVTSRIFHPGMQHSTYRPARQTTEFRPLVHCWVNEAGLEGNDTRRVPLLMLMQDRTEEGLEMFARPGGSHLHERDGQC
ncbi:hypothetical protein CALCODRAFT_518523 [Calocera cornea HHB12733]|uniref:Beta-lactamase-related domain-containing protein n=1 Tax=Calocera cornea HHB12733 TaxID=1353952 RepID=A0A165EYX0_9BASI|nr:hypothetical protein CALCODRAFT_518523 [Calocera cornea HHB12733]